MSFFREFEFRPFVIWVNLFSGFVISTIVWLTTAQLHLNYLQQETLLENERLIDENIRNRYDALKNQIDPHFLFNSLNTLNVLIGFDNNRAHKYVEKMSSVLRYTIQNKEITTLQDEINIANSYAYLIKIRYGDNFRIETDISSNYLLYSIIPISVQHLIENAVKHNVVSAKHPLVVRIYTTERDSLVVENDIRTKAFAPVSSGIGLANLCERYKLMFHKEVIISNTDNVFRVEIPIIKNASLQTCKLLTDESNNN
jgi:LytS/YehU family sensor histidine kinase